VAIGAAVDVAQLVETSNH